MWSRMDAEEPSSDWTSVFTAMNSTPSTSASIIRLTAFTPAPPTPTTRRTGSVGRSRAARPDPPRGGRGRAFVRHGYQGLRLRQGLALSRHRVALQDILGNVVRED